MLSFHFSFASCTCALICCLDTIAANGKVCTLLAAIDQNCAQLLPTANEMKSLHEIGVLDTIAANGKDAWFSSSEIAFGLPTKPTNPEAPMLLDRMLRLLVSHSVLKCRIKRSDNALVFNVVVLQ
ncbi:hypothetical protein YC2023_043468 [Brassica napus]